MANYLITGYHGEPHVTAENDKGIHAALFGKGKFVLPVGEQFRAEYIGNNTIRVYDGKLIDNGAAAGIPAGQYIDLPIANAGQGVRRNDLIVFQYRKEGTTMVESGSFVVVQGTEGSTPVDPEITEADLLSDDATFDQMVLWRVPVAETTISAPVKLFSVWGKAEPITISTSTTIGAKHAEKVLLVNSESAVTLILPSGMPIGSMITVSSIGTGSVTFTPATDVTINSLEDKRTISGRYAAVSLCCVAENAWMLWGALE